jgi:hypothetical protein
VFLLTPLKNVLRRGLLSLQAKNEVARFEGIIISDPQDTVSFRETVLEALRLIKDLDPRRFRRIQRHIKWIVNMLLPYGGAQYAYSMRTCKIDFEKSVWDAYSDFRPALCACLLVHEATHGLIHAWNIPYSSQLRSRIERLCVTEEQRFLSHVGAVRPDVAEAMWHDFDESQWHRHWNDSIWRNFLAFVSRLARDSRAHRTNRELVMTGNVDTKQ